MKETFANAVNVMILVDVYLVHLVEEQFVTGCSVDLAKHQDAFDDCVDGQHQQSDCQWTKDIWLNCHVVQAHPPVSSSCIAHVCAIHADLLVLRWDDKVDKLVVERPSVNIRLQEEFVATSCQSHRKSQGKFHKKYAREQDPVDGVVFPQGSLGEGLCVEIGNRRNHPADPVEEEKFDFVNPHHAVVTEVWQSHNVDIMEMLEKFEAEEQLRKRLVYVNICFEKFFASGEVCVWFREVLNKRST